MVNIFFLTLKEGLEKESRDCGQKLEVLYDTSRRISDLYVDIVNTPLYGEEGYFITCRIDIHLTSDIRDIRVASVTIPASLGFQEAQQIYERLKLLDVHIFTPSDGEYNPKKWMRKTYPYDQGLTGTIFPGLDSEE